MLCNSVSSMKRITIGCFFVRAQFYFQQWDTLQNKTSKRQEAFLDTKHTKLLVLYLTDIINRV